MWGTVLCRQVLREKGREGPAHIFKTFAFDPRFKNVVVKLMEKKLHRWLDLFSCSVMHRQQRREKSSLEFAFWWGCQTSAPIRFLLTYSEKQLFGPVRADEREDGEAEIPRHEGRPEDVRLAACHQLGDRPDPSHTKKRNSCRIKIKTIMKTTMMIIKIGLLQGGGKKPCKWGSRKMQCGKKCK